MKIRSGFVSNSSSSSFCVFGVAFDNTDDVALAMDLDLTEPEKVPACGHQFDRAAANYCPQCGKKAFKEVDNYYWTEKQVDAALKLHGLGRYSYDEAGTFVGVSPGGSGQKLIDTLTEVNTKCLELFQKEASIHEGEYAC